MRLVTFQHGHRTGLGLLTPDGEGLVDLAAAGPGLPERMRQLICDESAMASVQALADRVTQGQAGLDSTLPILPLAAVRLAAPVPDPSKIVCVGYNYRGHRAEGRIDDPEFPDIFAKATSCLIGPSDAVVLPGVSREVDHEGELAIIIGRPGRDIPVDQAADHIAGYSVFNDVTARDWQHRFSQWFLGKSFDTFGVLGPALVTPDEVGDLGSLELTVCLNGQVKVQASTETMIFSIGFLVSYISQVMTLEPGDIIATGTPQKLPEALAENRFLGPGDEVTVTINRVGRLTTRFTAAT